MNLRICDHNKVIQAPIVLGGLGGSGTRLVAEILVRMGFFLGNNLNRSNDNLEFLKLFPELRKLMQQHNAKRNSIIDNHVLGTLTEITHNLYLDYSLQTIKRGWGWKVPTNFYILEYLKKVIGKFKYIHVIRHGLDMAFSENQNQLFNWGFYFGIQVVESTIPKSSLDYWIMANEFTIKKANEILDKCFYLLNFDNLCCNPTAEIQRLGVFLEIDDIDFEKLALIVKKPDTIGRYRTSNLLQFSSNQIEIVRSLGFIVT